MTKQLIYFMYVSTAILFITLRLQPVPEIMVDNGNKVALLAAQSATDNDVGAEAEIAIELDDVSKASGFTALMLENAWRNLRLPCMEGTGEAFLRAEQEAGVNAVVLAAIAMHESGGGSSRLAKGKNNLYGFGAYGADPYKRAHYFNSKEECIVHVAHSLSKNYLSRSGRYHSGTTLSDINVHYAEDPNWSVSVARCIQSIACAAEEGE